MNEFDFKPVDQEGENTLKNIALADHFNRWMYSTIKPFCSGEILEIGSGLGNISAFFLEDRAHIVLTDIRDVYCDTLRDSFSDCPTVKGITTMDFADPEFDQKFSGYFNSFDTVFALNVLEHVFDEKQAISNGYKLLKPGGRLIILVPAFQWLFNNFDKELEHYRRYNRQKLESLFLDCNLKVIHTQYFNVAGMAGWYVSGKLQRNKLIPAGQMKLYNTLVPVFKLLDKMVFHSFGLSVISVGEK